MDLNLTGKRALVTGASQGIGRAIVLALAQHGVAVAACDNQESEAITSLAVELEHLNNGSYVFLADVSDEAAVTLLIDDVRQRFHGIEMLVNNSAAISHYPLSDMTLVEWRRVLDMNLTSVYLVTHAVQDMIVDGGSIITIASTLAAVGMRGKTHYTASKAGMIGFTRSLCKEIGSRAIRANVIAPGLIETPQQTGDLTPEQLKRYTYLAALGRLGQPEDVANAVLFLASDLSSFITGATITVDGGVGGTGFM